MRYIPVSTHFKKLEIFLHNFSYFARTYCNGAIFLGPLVTKNLFCNNFAYISSPLCSVNAEENNFNSDETDFTQDENNFTSDGNDFTSENTYQQHSTVSWDNGLIKFYDRNLVTETYYKYS